MLSRLCTSVDVPGSHLRIRCAQGPGERVPFPRSLGFEAVSVGTGQLIPKSTRTLVNLYPFLVNSYFSQLVPKSTRTLVYL